MKRGVIVRNRYYTDAGMEYVFERLCACMRARGVHLDVGSPTLAVTDAVLPTIVADFVVFWDKDIALARAIEQSGIRCFNSADAIAVCDDKLATYLALRGRGIRLIDTVAAPMRFPVNDGVDQPFLDHVAATFGFPLVVKARVGSRGEQVVKVTDRNALTETATAFMHTPYICQRFIGASEGRDVRVYVIGRKAVCAVARQGQGFLSNAAAGAKARLTDVAQWRNIAERAAETLALDYGAVDFLTDGSLVEVNSNAYFKAAERAGADIADAYASYIVREVYGG